MDIAHQCEYFRGDMQNNKIDPGNSNIDKYILLVIYRNKLILLRLVGSSRIRTTRRKTTVEPKQKFTVFYWRFGLN